MKDCRLSLDAGKEKQQRDRHARLCIAVAVARHMGTHPEKVPAALIDDLQALAAPQAAAPDTPEAVDRAPSAPLPSRPAPTTRWLRLSFPPTASMLEAGQRVLAEKGGVYHAFCAMADAAVPLPVSGNDKSSRLVPCPPTETMCRAGLQSADHGRRLEIIFREMLGAAPLGVLVQQQAWAADCGADAFEFLLAGEIAELPDAERYDVEIPLHR